MAKGETGRAYHALDLPYRVLTVQGAVVGSRIGERADNQIRAGQPASAGMQRLSVLGAATAGAGLGALASGLQINARRPRGSDKRTLAIVSGVGAMAGTAYAIHQLPVLRGARLAVVPTRVGKARAVELSVKTQFR